LRKNFLRLRKSSRKGVCAHCCHMRKPPGDIVEVERSTAMAQTQARLVVIDPVVPIFGPDVNNPAGLQPSLALRS
jgi:hypothetical protein